MQYIQNSLAHTHYVLTSKVTKYQINFLRLCMRVHLAIRNVWQSPAYCPLGVVVSPLANTNETPNYWSAQAAPPPSERRWTNRGKIVDTGCREVSK